MSDSKSLQTLNERIADRIGKELVDLIPPEQWQELVDSEIAKFKQQVAPGIIQELLKEAYTTQVRRAVDALCSTDEWDELTSTHTNAKLTELLAASGGTIFAGVMQPAMSIVLQDLRSRLGY